MDHYQVGPLWLQMLLLWIGITLNSILPAQDSGNPRLVEVVDGVVRLSAPEDGGIPLVEFIEIGQSVTGKVFTYSAREMASDARPVRNIYQRNFGFFVIHGDPAN